MIKKFAFDKPIVKFAYELLPKEAPYANVIATIKNKPELLILVGEADVYSNGVLVEKKRIEDCYRNGQFKLSLGIDKNIYSNYKSDEQKSIIRSKKIECTRKIEIRNDYTVSKNVFLFDQLEIKEMKVKLKSLEIDPQNKSKIISSIVNFNNLECSLEIAESTTAELTVIFKKKIKKQN